MCHKRDRGSAKLRGSFFNDRELSEISPLLSGYWLVGSGSGQGCVRGVTHGRGEAKAKATQFCPRSVLEVEPSKPVLEDPHPRDATHRAAMPRRLSVHSIRWNPSLKFNALLPPLVRLCMKYVLYCIYGML